MASHSNCRKVEKEKKKMLVMTLAFLVLAFSVVAFVAGIVLFATSGFNGKVHPMLGWALFVTGMIGIALSCLFLAFAPFLMSLWMPGWHMWQMPMMWPY